MRIQPVSGLRLSTSPAVEAFLFDFAKIAPAYEYNWTQQSSFESRAAYLNGGGYRGDRAALAAALRSYNQALGAAPETMANIDLLAKEGTLAVVTGQQAGIFTGPAYSVYKAITAIHLARQQSGRLGVPVVPVFWVAAEDHDWQEVSWVMTPWGESMGRVALHESFDGDRRSVGLAPAPASLPQVIEEFLALLPETEFKAEVAERIKSAAIPGGSLVDWFVRLITWLFEGTGLVIINPSDPAIRRIEAPFFERAIRSHEAVEEGLGKGYELFEQLGFKPTVDRQLGNLNLFTYVNGERLPIVGAGENFWIRDREEIGWSLEELVDRANTHPELFSTNVVLRPVVQSFLLPDLAYVGGPGEVTYFGLYKQVYTALGQQMPVVYPRESFTLVEPPIARILEKQGLSLTDAVYKLDERRKEFMEREDRLGLNDLFQNFRSDFEQLYGNLVNAVLQLDPNLQHVTEENRKQIAVQINKLEEKARQQHRKNLEVALRQFDRLKANLYPDGLQERSVSVLPYLAKYGPDLVRTLCNETSLGDGWEHRAVYLGS